MRRQIAAVGATLTACGSIILGTGTASATATPQVAQANAALRYLYAQVGTDGSIAGSLGATEDTIISVADNGYDPATLKNPTTGTSAYDYLSAKVATITTAGGAAKYILAWAAAGKPAAIDATVLVTRLNAPVAGSGYLNPNGAFHNGTPAVETANAYSQSLAVLADVAAGHLLPTNATTWLTCAQRADGGFGYVIDDSLAAPPVFCGDTSSDTNDSAIILQALGAAKVKTANAKAVTYLHGVQQPTGGFGFVPGPSDPSSDQGVINALAAIGQDPTAAAWTVAGGNAVTDMESFADPKGTGGYVFPGNAGPDPFTTSSVPQALAFMPYASLTHVLAGTSPPPPGGILGAAATPPPAPSSTVPVPDTGAGRGGPALGWILIAAGAVGLAVAAGWRRSSSAP